MLTKSEVAAAYRASSGFRRNPSLGHYNLTRKQWGLVWRIARLSAPSETKTGESIRTPLRRSNFTTFCIKLDPAIHKAHLILQSRSVPYITSRMNLESSRIIAELLLDAAI